AAIDFGRPSVIGSTRPGNSTVLRTGTTISASGGKAGIELAPREAPSFALICCSATMRSCFLQRHDQTTGGSGAAHAGIMAGRQAQGAVRASMAEVEPAAGG